MWKKCRFGFMKEILEREVLHPFCDTFLKSKDIAKSVLKEFENKATSLELSYRITLLPKIFLEILENEISHGVTPRLFEHRKVTEKK